MKPAYHFDTHTANVKLTATIPYTRVPLKTDGTRIFSGTIQVPAGSRVRIELRANALHAAGNQTMVACWFMDDEDEARGTQGINHIGAGFMGDLSLVDYSPVMDGEPHTFHINVGSFSGAIVLNGMDPTSPGAPQMYGGSLVTTFILEER